MSERIKKSRHVDTLVDGKRVFGSVLDSDTSVFAGRHIDTISRKVFGIAQCKKASTELFSPRSFGFIPKPIPNDNIICADSQFALYAVRGSQGFLVINSDGMSPASVPNGWTTIFTQTSNPPAGIGFAFPRRVTICYRVFDGTEPDPFCMPRPVGTPPFETWGGAFGFILTNDFTLEVVDIISYNSFPDRLPNGQTDSRILVPNINYAGKIPCWYITGSYPNNVNGVQKTFLAYGEQLGPALFQQGGVTRFWSDYGTVNGAGYGSLAWSIILSGQKLLIKDIEGDAFAARHVDTLGSTKVFAVTGCEFVDDVCTTTTYPNLIATFNSTGGCSCMNGTEILMCYGVPQPALGRNTWYGDGKLGTCEALPLVGGVEFPIGTSPVKMLLELAVHGDPCVAEYWMQIVRYDEWGMSTNGAMPPSYCKINGSQRPGGLTGTATILSRIPFQAQISVTIDCGSRCGLGTMTIDIVEQ